MVSTRRRPILAVYIDDSSPCSSVEVAPPKKLNVSTRSRSRLKNITNTASTSRLVKVAPPKKKQVSTIRTTPPSESIKCLRDLIQNAAISGGTFTAPDSSGKNVPSISGGTSTSDWLPDGWRVSVWFTSTGHTYTVFKETATRKKFYSKPEVLNYLGIADSSNSNNRKVVGETRKRIFLEYAEAYS
ncbi:DNA-binding domain-containing protein [Artemisia annua]|uniref:DNA-binding domain-containing protein n=1 Tax=Artemisia annua TaxID=35608 RepID=A0A2U1KH96_ARTAN|nr:DNA-binding domain-containing protein [Artemisia annua]